MIAKRTSSRPPSSARLVIGGCRKIQARCPPCLGMPPRAEVSYARWAACGRDSRISRWARLGRQWPARPGPLFLQIATDFLRGVRDLYQVIAYGQRYSLSAPIRDESSMRRKPALHSGQLTSPTFMAVMMRWFHRETKSFETRSGAPDGALPSGLCWRYVVKLSLKRHTS